MDTIEDLLFNPASLTQYTLAGEGGEPRLPAGVGPEHAVFRNVHEGCLLFAATSFALLNVKTAAGEPAAAGPILFPARLRRAGTRVHLAPVSKLCLLCEWNPAWLSADQPPPDDLKACDISLYDGYNFYAGSVTQATLLDDRPLVYRAFSSSADKKDVVFAPADDAATLAIAMTGIQITRAPIQLIRCTEHTSPQALAKDEMPAKFALMALKHQIMSWNLNTRLLDAMTHLAKLVDEVTSRAHTLLEDVEREKTQIVERSLLLINEKKKEIERLRGELAAARGGSQPAEPPPPPEPVGTVEQHTPRRARQPKAKAKTKTKAKAKAKTRARRAPSPPEEPALATGDSPMVSAVVAVEEPAAVTDASPVSTSEEPAAPMEVEPEIDLFGDWGATDEDD